MAKQDSKIKTIATSSRTAASLRDNFLPPLPAKTHDDAQQQDKDDDDDDRDGDDQYEGNFEVPWTAVKRPRCVNTRHNLVRGKQRLQLGFRTSQFL